MVRVGEVGGRPGGGGDLGRDTSDESDVSKWVGVQEDLRNNQQITYWLTHISITLLSVANLT